ncbi:unnamed protein product, partial [Polarella glacialis]
GVSEGNGPPSSRGKQFTPRSAAAVGGSELRLRPTLWPNLELDPKDVEAMNWWYSSVEAPLAQALPDARCPYPWLPDTHPPDSHEVLAHLSEPYVFEDWKKTWNHPDDSGFEKWLEAMAEKGLEGQRDFTPRLKAHAYAETPGSSRGLRATAADGSEHGVSPEGLDPPASLASWQAQRCSASSSSIGLKPPRGDRSDGRGMSRCASSASAISSVLRRTTALSLTPRQPVLSSRGSYDGASGAAAADGSRSS